MKVYEFKGFPNPARVRMALAEKGLMTEPEFVQVDLPGGEHKTEAFLTKSPSGVKTSTPRAVSSVPYKCWEILGIFITFRYCVGGGFYTPRQRV